MLKSCLAAYYNSITIATFVFTVPILSLVSCHVFALFQCYCSTMNLPFNVLQNNTDLVTIQL